MSRKAVTRILIVVSAVLVLSSCKAGSHKPAPGTVTTQTVAPAAAQPAPTGTDAMTQTVNVDNGRSEEEGASTSDTAAAPTTTPAAKTPKSAKSAKKHR